MFTDVLEECTATIFREEESSTLKMEAAHSSEMSVNYIS
jgi:hypothetical protein